MKNGILFIGIFAVLSSACGNSSPSTFDFLRALEAKMDKKGCATSHLFNTFPIEAKQLKHNQDTLKVFESAGLIELSGKRYILSDLGKKDYDASRKGFCFAQKYLISDVKIVNAVPKEKLPPMVSEAWVVSFEVAPAALSDWATTSEFIEAVDSDSFVMFLEPAKLTAQFYKLSESDELELKGPAPSFRPGATFGVGF